MVGSLVLKTHPRPSQYKALPSHLLGNSLKRCVVHCKCHILADKYMKTNQKVSLRIKYHSPLCIKSEPER